MKNFKLIPIHLSSLKNTEFAQLLVRFFEDFEKSGLDLQTDTDFKRLFELIQAKKPTLDEALDQVRGSEESEKIMKADKERDNLLKALRSATNAYKYSTNPKEKDAFATVNLLLSEYKNVENDGYEQATYRLSNLTERLQNEEYKDAVKELSLSKFVSNLASANVTFNELFARRSSKAMQKPSYNVKELRKELTTIYKDLTDYTYILARIRNDDFFTKALGVINNGRKYFADTIIARRNAGKVNSKKA
ncbi:conserved hypothetical protein [Capnocytophaga canimorsus]|uniref:Uncharacterized protein n=1 Tax=Capnocytophaga canimorsus TaxID=28188 RepID=A0A0B7HDR1_9FLAO|nr:DUF6261 family protein [Capnocytophaga canimorsus]ATA77762.1 hypothetical protein CGC47_09315 [Capnocytophaga canimorsus]PJI76590.1 hypothetical protein CLV61_1995 [Capnocytophaga canimorsus]CEN36759.1 conserved hypothetical protein [Capnocytophaga canimorsus]STA73049.1 Uncharacterised protein [Capnocytophaga canimorsus]